VTDPGKSGKRALLLGLWAALALTSCSGPGREPAPEPEVPPPAEVLEPQEVPAPEPEEPAREGGLPQVIPLEAGEEPPPVLEAGDPDAALASEDVVFSDRLDSGVELEIRRTNPVPDNGTIFYDVYVLTRTPGTDWTVLGRLSEYNHYVGNFGLDTAERVPDILGQEGWQISLVSGAAAVKSWYFAAAAEGAEFLFDVGSSERAQVLDLDGDGQGESLEFYNHGEAGWSLYDRDSEGRYWRYFLAVWPAPPEGVAFLEGVGFVPADGEGNALLGADGNPPGRYLLEDGALRLHMAESALSEPVPLPAS
jgi:hypothetical protein